MKIHSAVSRISTALLVAGTLATTATVARADLETVPVTGAAITSQITGTVAYIDQDKRIFTLKLPDGSFRVMHVPDEVKNLQRVKIGNRLTIAKTEAILIDLRKGSDAGTIGATTDRQVQQDPGVKPTGAIVDTLKLYGKIESVSKQKSQVTVRGPHKTVTFKVRDPALLGMLQPGDGVVATYITMISGGFTFD